MEKASEFADLSDLGRLVAGIVEQTTDPLIGRGQLLLRGLALGDFLLLMELGERQPQREGEKRCRDDPVCKRTPVLLFPVVHQQTYRAEEGDEDQIGT